VVNASLSRQSTGPPERSATYQLDGHDLELLNTFQTRAVLTLGTEKASRTFENESLRLASAVGPLSSGLVNDTDLDGSASLLDACGADVDTDA
jgi:hypothetical protein